MTFDGLPVVIGWELTLACNLRCRHCGSTAGQARRQELTLAESLAICDQFPELLVQRVDFSGGEPLLNPNWAKIAARLTELGIRVEMITNGLGLSQDTVEVMRKAGIPSIGVSLDGLEETHNYIRGRSDAFQRSVEGMRRTRQGGVVLTAMTTANAMNIDELPGLFQLLESLEVAAWQIQPVVPFGRSLNASELLLTKEGYLRLGDFVQEYAPRAEAAGIQLVTADSLGYFAEFETCTEPWRGCSAGLVGCAITSDGMVKGCLSMPNDFVEGDLRERELWDIWFDPNAFAYNRQFTRDQLGPECRDCDRAEDCQGGCSSKSYSLTGRFHNDPMCYYKFGRGR